MKRSRLLTSTRSIRLSLWLTQRRPRNLFVVSGQVWFRLYCDDWLVAFIIIIIIFFFFFFFFFFISFFFPFPFFLMFIWLWPFDVVPLQDPITLLINLIKLLYRLLADQFGIIQHSYRLERCFFYFSLYFFSFLDGFFQDSFRIQ